MNVGVPITISTPVGWIGGTSGSYESTRVLSSTTSGQHNRFFSYGANWNMLSQAGYGSTGDIAATRVNASEFAINSTNINTLFAPIASPSFTGNATVSGTLTTSNDVVINTGATGARYGRVMSHDQYHAMILRGDINYSAPNYTVTGGQDATTFVQFGGNYRFRQVTNLMNALLFEITPTHVNVGNSLRIGGTSTDTLNQQRTWIQAVIPSATVNGPVTITTQSGVATASASRSATGTYALTWSPNINNGRATCAMLQGS